MQRTSGDSGPRIVLLSYAQVQPRNLQLLRTAAARSGLVLQEVAPHELGVRIGERAVPLHAGRPLRADLVLHRTVHPYRALVVPVLDALTATGALVLNPPQAALTSRNKLATLLTLHAAGLPVVPTEGLAPPAAPDWRPAPAAAQHVSKPALGAQGRGVERGSAAEVASRLRSGAYDPADGPLLVQPAVPAPYDLRAYVVGDRVAALGLRRAAPGEWRCNVGLGATVEPVRDRLLAAVGRELAVSAVRALGLDHAAVDLLPDPAAETLLLSEVDAWGGFAGLQDGLGEPVAERLLAWAVDRLRTHQADAGA